MNNLLQYLIVSLFSGWGGGDSGFHKAFFKTLLAVDNNLNSRQNFMLNYPGVDVQGWDLMTVKAAFILNYLGLTQLAIDCLLMSPPCSGISKAGKCDPYHPLNLLFLRSIRHMVPGLMARVFLIENVPMEGGMLVFYNLVQDELSKLKGEYHIKEGVLNSIEFGSPQNRSRFFILGIHKSLGVLPSFPEPTTPLLSQQKRIMDVLPTVDGIAYGYGWKKFKHKTEQLNTMTKTPNFVPVYNGVNGEFTKREVLDMCGYDAGWKTTGSFLSVWNRAGNSIMPDVSIAWATHIRDNILGKAAGAGSVTTIPTNGGGGTRNLFVADNTRLIVPAPPKIVDIAGTAISASIQAEKDKQPVQFPTVVKDKGKIIHGDCLKEMTKLASGSVDMVLTDLPYGLTAYKWDSVIPFDGLWEEWKRVLKPNGMVALFASGKFVGQCMTSNSGWYKYMWTWVKSNPTNFANAKKQPLRKCEHILVFYKGQCTYNPQGVRKILPGEVLPSGAGALNRKFSGNGVSPEGKLLSSGFKERDDGMSSQTTGTKISRTLGNGVSPEGQKPFYIQQQTGYPADVLYFPKAIRERDWDNFHPTQKPVDLLRYLIRTYTNPGDSVLDCCAGSMSTGVAALLEERRYILIEKDGAYFQKGVERITRYERKKNLMVQ